MHIILFENSEGSKRKGITSLCLIPSNCDTRKGLLHGSCSTFVDSIKWSQDLNFRELKLKAYSRHKEHSLSIKDRGIKDNFQMYKVDLWAISRNKAPKC